MPKSKKPAKDDLINELTADLQRLQADFINFRNRSETNRVRDIQNGKEMAIQALLPVLDNIDRAIAHEPEDIKDHQWVKGITQLAKQLDSQLESLGVYKINAVDEEFDPYRHEALAMDDGEGDKEIVTEILQPGYRLEETIIRPAKVKVKRKQ